MSVSQEFVKSLFEYKDGNLYWIAKSGVRSHAIIGGKAGGYAVNGYESVSIKGVRFYTHRIIFLFHYGYIPKCLDHINGIRNDNRIENLRDFSFSQNMCNSKIHKNNKTGIKGVFKKASKYCVQVRFNNKQNYFGSFEDLEFAELVAIEARIKLHGIYAKHI